ncbi:monocarboxylate transporter, putative, partial [Ixodes scapularis]
LISGPLAHKFTARPVALVGGFISALGLMLCFFATSIQYLVVTLGIVHAIGSGMVFVVIPTVINEHFLKYRGLAMGINFAGSTMGTFVFPKLLEFFSHHYGFRGALLLFGALSLHSIAFSLFLRQPVWLKRHLAEQAALAAKKFPLEKEDPRTQDADVKKAPVNTGSFRHGLTVFSSPMFY